MHRTNPDNLKPCPHMETLVSAWVDDNLSGFLRWYTQWHVAHCPRCAAAIPVLKTLRARLRSLENKRADPASDVLPERRLTAVQSAWERGDGDLPASPPP